ncbi:unnamed protein product [Staurois parvus]|uniref:Uncharacterized protein n=1 Tax=Staurois parvus TaxID=386267 RepID=A0ABN9H8J3_9NEOB|nr:unnamed protein product [Staurois parvus]
MQCTSRLNLAMSRMEVLGQGLTDHLETWALAEGPGCPWYLFHRLF